MSAAPERVPTDLVIVGAGPAGVSAALWAGSLGLSALVVESAPEAGGQLRQIHFQPANVAIAPPARGPELADRLGRQLSEGGIEVRYGAPAMGLEPSAPAVRLASGERLAASSVLVATGVRRRPLEVPGERELEGRGVSYSATQDRDRYAGEPVLVVGGGDAAFENALLLAEVGSKIVLAMRGRPRARREFRERVAASPAIETLEQTRVLEVIGPDRVRAARLAGPAGTRDLPVAAVFVKIGVAPNSEWCRGALEMDADGYVIVDGRFTTSEPRVWAVGDVTRPLVFAISVATGQGASAAAAIRATLRDR